MNGTGSTASREFELLATRMEAALAPMGARIKSPDRIRDKVTGELREVDASIRYALGSVEILATLECRKRGRIQDVTWIEQIATKRDHIGAHLTIAISSKGFSAGAVAVAASRSIALRVISQPTDEDIRSIVGSLIAFETGVAITLDDYSLHCFGTFATPPVLVAQSQDQLRSLGIGARVFLEEGCETPLSLAQRLSGDSTRKNPNTAGSIRLVVPPHSAVVLPLENNPIEPFFADVPTDGASHRKSLKISLETRNIAVETTKGLQRLSSIDIEVTATYFSRPISAKPIAYINEQGEVSYFTEHRVQLGSEQSLTLISSHGEAVSKLSKKPKMRTDDGK